MEVNCRRAMTEVLKNKVIRHQFKKKLETTPPIVATKRDNCTVLRNDNTTGNEVSILNRANFNLRSFYLSSFSGHIINVYSVDSWSSGVLHLGK
jgi:hypothetical protein